MTNILEIVYIYIYSSTLCNQHRRRVAKRRRESARNRGDDKTARFYWSHNSASLRWYSWCARSVPLIALRKVVVVVVHICCVTYIQIELFAEGIAVLLVIGEHAQQIRIFALALG